MTAGDLITTDWQVEYNGLLLGEATPYALLAIDGLLDLPEINSGDRRKLRRHGLAAGDDFAGGRTVTLTIEVSAEGAVPFAAAVKDLRRALVAGHRSSIDGDPELPLVLRIPDISDGDLIRIHARPRRRAFDIDLVFLYGLPTSTLQFHATDPRIYANAQAFADTAIRTATGGLTFNATFGLSFGATAQGGRIVAENTGDFPTPVVFRLDGPATNPVITHTDLDLELRLATTLDAGQFLILDSATESVLLNGTSDRQDTLAQTSTFFDLEPGINRIELTDDSSTTTAHLTAVWRSATI